MNHLELTEFDQIRYDDNGTILEWLVYSEHLLAHVPVDLKHIQKNYRSKYQYAIEYIQMQIDMKNYPTDIIEPDERWIKRTYDRSNSTKD